MTAPPPSRTSPVAGLTNAMCLHAIRLLTARETELVALLVIAREEQHALITARDFADSDRSGYIDRTNIWGTQ